MVFDPYDRSNIMDAFFKGKIKIDELSSKTQPKTVELGYGKGIGQKGTYSQYIKSLEEQAAKGNGIVSIGKSIKEKDIFSMPDITDKFAVGDVPYILITQFNTINPIVIKALWKNSEDEVVLEQFYEIPSAYSLNYDWWNQYGVYLIGPENLEEGNYKVDIESTEFGKGNKIKTFRVSLDFTVIEEK